MPARNIPNSSTKPTTLRAIGTAALIVALCTALVKGVSLGKELYVASRFGTGPEIEAFLVAFSVPSLLINVLAAPFAVSLVPLYVSIRERNSRAYAFDIVGQALTMFACVLVPISIVMPLLCRWYIPLIAHSFDSSTKELTTHYLVTMPVFLILGGMSSILGAILNAEHKFFLVASVPIITPLITLLAIAALPQWGAYSLCFAISFGALLELVLIWYTLKKSGFRFRFSAIRSWPEMRIISRQFSAAATGSFVMSGAAFIDQAIAAALGAGSVATLNYASKVTGIVLGLGAVGLGSALTPHLTQLTAKQDWVVLDDTRKRLVRSCLIFSVPFLIAMVLGSELIVRVLFQRGSFTSGDVERVALVQRWFAFQVPFYIAGTVLTRLLTSLHMNQVILMISVVGCVVKLVVNAIFVHSIGIVAVAMSTTCLYVVTFILCNVAAKRALKTKISNIVELSPAAPAQV